MVGRLDSVFVEENSFFGPYFGGSEYVLLYEQKSMLTLTWSNAGQREETCIFLCLFPFSSTS